MRFNCKHAHGQDDAQKQSIIGWMVVFLDSLVAAKQIWQAHYEMLEW